MGKFDHRCVTTLFQIIFIFSKFSRTTQSPHCYISKVEKTSNATLCENDYFIFPNIWTEENSTSGKMEENDFTLCCPVASDKTRVDDRQFWWPDEIHRGLSRAILNCNPSSIPGMETIKFLHYLNDNDDTSDYKEIFIGNRKSLRGSRFLKNAPLKIIIHGFMSSPFVGPTKALRKSYSQLPEIINIVAVHWEALANLVTASDSICYNIASKSTKLVGQRTAELIEFLVDEKLADLSNIHILGHSLGAHCAGFAGKLIKIGKLPRITGFDPARPNFADVSDSERIHHTDAHFVDIIHTATKDWKLLGIISLGLIPFPVGLQQPVGHADFYPNHGSHQPGCNSIISPTIPVLCSHARSYVYYAESIKYIDGKKQFESKECLDYAEVELGFCSGRHSVAMGEYTPKNNFTRKLYYLATKKRSPFVLDLE